MKKIVRLWIAFFILAACIPARAATTETVTEMTIHLVSGEQYSFKLPDDPVVTFEGSDINVTSAAANISLVRNAVENIDFAKVTASITDINDDSDFLFSFYNNNTVVIAGKNVSTAAVYSIKGEELLRQTAVASQMTLDISQLSAGIYIIAVQGYQSIKIIKH